MGVVIALDVGDRRIGVAKSDPLGMIASPLTTLHHKQNIHAEISRLVSEHGAEVVVVGLPKMLNNTLGIQAEKVLRFIETLKPLLAVPIVLWDERFTTIEANRLLRFSGGRRVGSSKKRQRYVRENVDEVAATLLLESYLARHHPSYE